MTAGITALPDELLVEICGLAAGRASRSFQLLETECDIPTLRSLCLSNVQLSRVATPLLYRTIEVDHGQPQNAGQLLRTLLCNPIKASFVHRVASGDTYTYGDTQIDLVSFPFRSSEIDHIETLLGGICADGPGLRRRWIKRTKKQYSLTDLLALMITQLPNLRSVKSSGLTLEMVAILYQHMEKQVRSLGKSHAFYSLQSFAITDEIPPYTRQGRLRLREKTSGMGGFTQLIDAPKALTEFVFSSPKLLEDGFLTLVLPNILNSQAHSLVKLAIQYPQGGPLFQESRSKFIKPSDLSQLQCLEHLELPGRLLFGDDAAGILQSPVEAKSYALSSMPVSLKYLHVIDCDEDFRVLASIKTVFQTLIEHKSEKFTRLQKLEVGVSRYPLCDYPRHMQEIQALGQQDQEVVVVAWGYESLMRQYQAEMSCTGGVPLLLDEDDADL